MINFIPELVEHVSEAVFVRVEDEHCPGSCPSLRRTLTFVRVRVQF